MSGKSGKVTGEVELVSWSIPTGVGIFGGNDRASESFRRTAAVRWGRSLR
jgi:hypothetical protein